MAIPGRKDRVSGQRWRKWSLFEWGAALFFVLLLTLELFSIACGGYSPNMVPMSASSPPLENKIKGPSTVQAGQNVDRELSVQATDPTNSGDIDVGWYPPIGASKFNFDPHHPPTNPDTGPPFTWNGVPPGTKMNVSYTSPEINSEYSDHTKDEFLSSRPSGTSDWTTWSAKKLHITPGGLQRSQAADTQSTSPDSPEQVRGASSPDQTYHTWDVSLWIDAAPGQPLTTELCQTWVDFLQQGSTFLALRFPLVGQNQPAAPYTILPVVFYGDTRPSFRVAPWGDADALVVPLEYKTQYFDFSENRLPATPDSQWLVLGLAAPAQTCPEGLAADAWSGIFSFQLEFGGDPDTCLGCVLEHYFCYEGDQAPPFFSASSLHLGASSFHPDYQGHGITCMGPLALSVQNGNTPALQLIASHMGQANPGEQVVFTHFLRNRSSTDLTVTLAHSSTLGLPWSFYQMLGWDQPDLSKPVTDTVTLPAMGEFWFTAVVDLPAEAEGVESLSLDASTMLSPTLSAHTSDALWIGGWLTPPPPPPTVTPSPTPTSQPTPTPTPTSTPQALYMPVVLRS